MGYCFINRIDSGDYASKKRFVSEILKDCDFEHETEDGISISETLLDYSLKGNHLWILSQRKEGDKKMIYIVLFLLARSEGSWGYKGIDESSGPVAVDCPQKFLKQSTCDAERAVKWREKCWKYHEEEKECKSILKEFEKNRKPGTIYRTHLVEGCNIPYVDLCEVNVRYHRKKVYYGEHNGEEWKILPRYIRKIEKIPLTCNEIQEQLNSCTGTSKYRHLIWNQILGTDGISLLIDLCQCQWLIDTIINLQDKVQADEVARHMCFWKYNSATKTLICERDTDDILLEHTFDSPKEFPLDSVTIYQAPTAFSGGEASVIYLPSEH